jgi:hypothetical protein
MTTEEKMRARDIAAGEAALPLLEELRRRLEAEHGGLAARDLAEPPTQHDQRRLYALREAVSQLDLGIDQADGTLPEVAEVLARPEFQPLIVRANLGLAPLRRRLAALRAAQAEAEERAKQPATRSYRYVGPPRKHGVGTRFLVPGEVVPLTAAQASAFSDRFELVGQEVATTS